MWNFIAVVSGTIGLAGVLFYYRPAARKILSASRWMLLTWGFLLLVHFTSPVIYHNFNISFSTWLYCGLWLATFVVADNVRFTLWSKADTERAPLRSVLYSIRTMRVLATLSIAGGILLVYTRLNTLSGFDITSVLYDLRVTQVATEDIGLAKTLSTVLASLGLIVGLVEISNAVRTRTRIPIRGGLSLLAYLIVPISAGGRSGFVLATISLIVAVCASIYLSGLGFAKFRALLIVSALMIVAALGYIMLVVSSRGASDGGSMDTQVAFMNRWWNCELRPGFTDSVRPFGVLGDTITDSFYYLSPQFYGLDFILHQYHGPFTMGGLEFAVFARRVENLFGIQILDPADKSDEAMFAKAGFNPHFFRTAVHATFVDFGLVLSIPFVFLCGALSRRARIRALQSKEPFSIALQALICSGATFTVISSPFGEGTFLFPLLWFIAIFTVYEGLHHYGEIAFHQTRLSNPAKGI
jgi:hypothetical protein